MKLTKDKLKKKKEVLVTAMKIRTKILRRSSDGKIIYTQCNIT